jgi:hypothetical protein
MRTSRTAAALAASALAATLLTTTTGAAAGSAAAGSAAAGSAAARPSASGCGATWNLVTAPPAAGDITSLSALSPHDTWLSGSGETLHWAGGSVKAVAGQMPQPPFASDEGDIGSFDSDTSGWEFGALWPYFTIYGFQWDVARWHGGRWTLIPLPPTASPQDRGYEVTAVKSLSPDNAWAAGYFYKAGRGTESGLDADGGLILHWNGAQWSIVANPASGRAGGWLQGITVASPTDIWAVGWQTTANGSTAPLTEHFNGTQWNVVSAPTGNGSSALYGVSVASSDSAWAVGDRAGPTGEAVPLVEHWDGAAWTVVTGLPDIGNSKLLSVYAASPDDVWASAAFPYGAEAFFLHWDGSTWAAVAAPGPQEYERTYWYQAIGGTGPGNIWATGFTFPADTLSGESVIAHLSCT